MIFSRAARRAGLSPEFTQGFSPRPRLSLGPPLAAGVTGLNEPADFWFNNWEGGGAAIWNGKLPQGLEIVGCAEVEGPALAKVAVAALYRIRGAGAVLDGAALSALIEEVGRTGILYGSSLEDGEIVLKTGDLEHCGAGNFVRALTSCGLIGGWRDLTLVRELVGALGSDGEIIPLV